ncbi:MAG TPA: hypothetical protein VEW94_13685 [Chloroflexia bacterium]|nr:hypothetical protein [Chloroflexia bacterium]
MSQDQGQTHDDRAKVQRAEHQSAQHATGPFSLAGPGLAPSYSNSLVGDARLNGRGNQPVKATVMRQMQRKYGNQAVQRQIANPGLNISHSFGDKAVQRWQAARQSLQRKCATCEEEQQGTATQDVPFVPAQPSFALQGVQGQEEEMPPGQGVQGQEEEMPPAQTQTQTVISRKAASSAPLQSAGSGAPVRIQRTATWAAGAVHQTNNLASAVVNGTPAGVTWPTLNGTTFWSAAAALAALVRPTLSFAAAASGGGVNATVTTVPTNTGSFDETVLSAGPWTTTVPKARIGAMFSALAACTGAGNSTFRAIGDPSDAAMATANRRHEDRHATDHQAAFNSSIVPWDARLTAAQTAGTTYNGANNAAAEAALYTAMGGTPDQVTAAFFNACQAAVVAYHSSAAGGPIGAPTNPTADANCANSSAKYTNPS